MPSDPSPSPFAEFQAYLKQGVLAYQWDASAEKPVFYPRLAAPETGGKLEWRKSAGTGRVHATTYVTRKDADPYNVAIIEMDEGFRLMSRVEGLAAEHVRIGMAVKLHIAEIADDTLIPVFKPLDQGQ